MGPRKGVGFQFVRLFLVLRKAVMTSKLFINVRAENRSPHFCLRNQQVGIFV